MESGGDIDPGQLAIGAGVAHGQVLVDFVDASVEGGEALALARDRVAAVLGEEGLVDAAAVVANFTMMTRIADGTGTPLDELSADVSADLRAQLHLDDLTSARLPLDL